MTGKARLASALKTSLPAALDLASQPVLWLIEAVFIGRLSAAALGGVGFALQIILLTVTLLLTFVMGAIILINRHLGSRNRYQANHVLGQTLMSGFLFSFAVMIVWYFGAPLLFRLIQENQSMASVTVTPLSGVASGIQYLRLVSFFAPILVLNFIATGMLRGSGDTHFSMTLNVGTNIANVILSPILIYGLLGFPRLEVRGAALALGISQTVGLCATVALLRSRKTVLFLSFRELATPRWPTIKQLFRLGSTTTVEQLVWSIGQVIVTSMVAYLGIRELAVHQLFLRIQAVLSMFYMGFGMAAMMHIGKHLGANEHHKAEKMGDMMHRMAFVFVIVLLGLMIAFSESFMHLFIRREDAILGNYDFTVLFVVFALVQLPKAMNTVITGSLRGAADIKWVMWTTILGVLLLELGLNWICAFVFQFGLLGIWTVQGLDEILKSAVNFLRFKCGKWKEIRL